jgi:hypothetical protein
VQHCLPHTAEYHHPLKNKPLKESCRQRF